MTHSPISRLLAGRTLRLLLALLALVEAHFIADSLETLIKQNGPLSPAETREGQIDADASIFGKCERRRCHL